MNPIETIDLYYPADSAARAILLQHSYQVTEKALAIALAHPELALDTVFVGEAAMLHDLGIFLCHAPALGCLGDAPYICHGYLGADLLRQAGYPRHARVCERHTGTGLSLATIEQQNLPIPHRDMCPQSIEEQLICFADKFYSKSKPNKEMPVEAVRKGLSKYGEATVATFDNWCKLFLGE